MEETPISQHLLLTPTPLSELGVAFESFERSAFRLEMLPAYDVFGEKEAFLAYLAGEENKIEFNEAWHSILKDSQRRNASVSRVRLIDERTPYIDFEIEWGYKNSVLFGERILTTTSKQIKDASFEAGLLFVKDFWIFDESKVFVMNYDFFGRFLGVLSADDQLKPIFNNFSRIIQSKSKEFI
ncbi:hypothetical protein DXT91_16535 [Agrobacterium tumefaciens]|uniref:DUF6879 family protein n=1 Tax=Agrobacterium tumefaciens TaxID=358 RepID=UPI0012B93BA8|nr:DUF6879 family protein [Agrobacterium tumefaciens]MQB05724.1 hypothetical protein [Agrobacterium tumefaciens]